MINVFCIDTSGPYCSLAVETNDRTFCHHERLERSHSQHVLDRIDALLRRAELAPRDIDLVGFGCGPGSFTGVRIAASLTQALALAANAKVVPLRTEAVLVAQAGHPAASIVSIPSRGDAYYLSRYEKETCREPSSLWTAPPSWLGADETTVAVLGAPPRWWTGSGATSAPERQVPMAEAMLSLARAAEAAALPPEAALPVYLEEDSPWQTSAARAQAQADAARAQAQADAARVNAQAGAARE